jgi:hypothetical protein
MKFLSIFNKSLNKAINKSLTVYNNNTRIIKRKTNDWQKKFLSEFKEYAFEVVYFIETRNGHYLKWIIGVSLFYFPLQNLYFIFRGGKEKMMYSARLLNSVTNYQKENLTPHDQDKFNENKIIYSYWVNYI